MSQDAAPRLSSKIVAWAVVVAVTTAFAVTNVEAGKVGAVAGGNTQGSNPGIAVRPAPKRWSGRLRTFVSRVGLGAALVAAPLISACNTERAPTYTAPGTTIEFKVSYQSGIASVYNPATQKVEWKESYKSGVAGVFNPVTQQVEWKTSYMSGVAGVFNPATQQVEWQTSYHGGVAGVYNPATQQVEWKKSYQSGVAGVFNPITQKVEWNTSYKSGIAGVFDPATQKVVWQTSYHSGVTAAAAILKGTDVPTASSSGFWGGDDE